MFKRMQRYFLTGVLAVAPLAITIWVLWKSYELIAATMSPWLQRIPRLTETYPDFVLTAIAFLSFLILITLVGLATRSLVGVAFFNVVERLIERIPVAKTIFTGTKQIAAVFLTDKRSAFQKVILFEYPRPQCYSLGFVTHDDPQHPMVNVFLPTTPNPTSGYMLLVPRDQAVILPLTIEDGIKLIISGGSVMSTDQAGLLREAATVLRTNREQSEEVR
jgi:uncharacterized membrane protein